MGEEETPENIYKLKLGKSDFKNTNTYKDRNVETELVFIHLLSIQTRSIFTFRSLYVLVFLKIDFLTFSTCGPNQGQPMG